MSAADTNSLTDAMRAAIQLVADDATNRLTEAVRLPTRNDAAEDSLRALLIGLYATYPQVLQPAAGEPAPEADGV